MDDLLIHDERAEEPSLAYLLSRMVYPAFPECVGVFRAVERPTYDDLLRQTEDVPSKGKGKLDDLFASDETWVVDRSGEGRGSVSERERRHARLLRLYPTPP